jgi:hypothetical protein
MAVRSTGNTPVATNPASAVVFSLAYGAGALLTYIVFVLLGWADVASF